MRVGIVFFDLRHMLLELVLGQSKFELPNT